MALSRASAAPYVVLRSLGQDWDHSRWMELADDGNRYEVLDGILYMSTVPSTFHQWIAINLVRDVALPLEHSGVGYSFTAPIGLLIPGAQPAQPDFLLVRHERAAIISDGRIRGVPDLIAEILSPANPELDTTTKRGIYARARVPEYWIVRPATRDLLLYWEPNRATGTYAREALIAPDGRLQSPTLPVDFAIAALFDGAPDTTL